MLALSPIKRSLSLFLFLSLFQAQAQHLNIRNHPMNQSLDIPTVYHSIQDSNGFRWFGTETGVVRFDGRHYRRFTLEDGLSDNEVLKIFEDTKKRIWFLTFNGHLSYFYKGRFYNKSNSALLKQIGAISIFSSVAEDKKGGLLFIGGQNRILYIGPDNQIRQYNNEKSGYPIGHSTIFEDTRGQVYVVCNTGFYKFDSGRLRPTRFRYFPLQVKAYYSPRPHELYFVAREGLVFMQDTVQQLVIPHHQLPLSSQADLLFIDSYQRLWIQSLGTGVYVLENFRNPRAGFKLYLKDVYISSISEDKETNLWFCTTGEGIFMLPASAAKTVAITKQEGLSDNKINAVAKDSRGNVWLALDKGKVARYNGAQVQEYDINFSDKFTRVTYLLVDRQDNIWCGTDHGIVQLKKLKNGRYKKIIKPYHVDGRHYAVKSIQQNKAGDITFVHSAGIEKFLDKVGKDGYYVTRIPQVERVRTYTHFYDQADHLWYGNLKGLHQIRPDSQRIDHWQDNPGLAYRITSIKALPGGILLLATYGHGIILLKDGKLLTQVTKQNGLSSNICRKLFVDHNTVWVATNEGVNRLNFSQGTLSNVEIFRTTDGLLSDHILDILGNQDHVYVATSQGLNILPNLKQKRRQPAPPIQLTGVTIGSQNIGNKTNPHLQYFQNRIQFEFIGITFQDAKNIMYQYRLIGSNPAWTPTQNTTLEFSALQPGTYAFEVKTKNQNSNWSKPIRYTFVIAPPFWQTWWFLSLLVLLVIIIISAGVRIYIGFKVAKQMRRLETDYRLQQERERIARDLHDNVGSNLAYIINSLEETPGQENQASSGTNQELREYTKQAITQLRETIWAVRQETISVGELGGKIQKLIWQASHHRNDFQYVVHLQGDQERKLTPVQALNLFRIAQEAIHNVFKHSQSNRLVVTLIVLDQGALEMRVKDKGKGFDPASQPQQDHYGLANMQARAKELGAYFKINTLPGKGTLVYVKTAFK
jgi:signal transduction histidine kinase/ligand-binding sensor domain-containing protein